MKIEIRCFLLSIILIFASMPIVLSADIIDVKEKSQSVSIFNDQNDKSRLYTPGTYLIDTEWGQHGDYKELCPINLSDGGSKCRLGCWSVAIGQITNYHQLPTEGYVDYFCTYSFISPNHIENNLDEHDYNWSNMASQLDGSSTPEEKDNVSQYLYDVATVIQKDFGTGSYCTIVGGSVTPMLDELKDHIVYISQLNTIWDNDLTQAEIIDEIDDNRPLMFYMRTLPDANNKRIAHAVAIDGYNFTVGGLFEVHINYGWDGSNNDWYNYDGVFPGDGTYWFDDTAYRKAMFIRLAPQPPEVIGPITGLPEMNLNFSAKTIYEINPPLYYRFDWGDNTMSDWLGRYDSGEVCIASHKWENSGIYEIRVQAKDVDDWESEWSEPHTITIGPRTCGDANADGTINVSDAVFIINYVFVPGFPAPSPLCFADANGDGSVGTSDAIYLINYAFIPGSPAPVANCCPR